MSAPVDADAVWAVLEPLGWTRRLSGDGFAKFTPPSTRWERLSVDMHATEKGRTWININIQHDFIQDIAPALAALSQLIAHAAEDGG